MNKKQIEAKIREEINNIEVPDLKNQILAQVPNRKVVVNKEKKHFRLAFHLSYLSVFLILIISVVLIAKNIDNNSLLGGKSEEETPIKTPEETEVVIRDVSNVEKSYARQAATLVGFAGGMSSDTQGVKSYLTTGDDFQEIAETLNKYFVVASNLIDEENTIYEFEVLTEGKYQYKLTVNNNILNDSVETIMYYNETSLDGSKKDDLNEVSTQLEGLIVQNGISYEFYGEKEIEDDECEVELIIIIDDANYLKVSQEIEHNEKEFEYKFYNGDPKKNKPYKTVEIEIDGDNVTIEIAENDEKSNIEFKYTRGQNKNEISANYHKNNKNYENIKIDEDDENKENYKYDFGDGKKHSVKKGNNHKDSNEKSDYPSETEKTHQTI